MGGSNSRSTSQENEEQGQPQQANLVIATMERPGKITTTTTTSTSSHFLDFGSNSDSDQTSENSLLSINNDQRALLNHKSSSGLGNPLSSVNGGGSINSDEIGNFLYKL